MERIFETVAEKCKRTDFLESVMQKAHYGAEDWETLCGVLGEIFACMEGKAGCSSRAVPAQVSAEPAGCQEGTRIPAESAEFQEVVMTLGAGVDELQDRYLREGNLTEAYMVEVLGSEILLIAYGAYNQWISEHTDQNVRRYYFLGTEYMGENETAVKADKPISLALEKLPAILKRSGLPVSCTEGYCMVPKKSVAFYAQLSKDKSVNCEGVCMGCGRKDCPNRMEGGAGSRGNKTLDRPLTYGYARIFGL